MYFGWESQLYTNFKFVQISTRNKGVGNISNYEHIPKQLLSHQIAVFIFLDLEDLRDSFSVIARNMILP